MRRFLLALPAAAVMALLAQARDDADPIKLKLEKAKAAYAGELEKFRKDIAAHFDRREEAARKEGNKKLVDQVKAERKAFEEQGMLPATAPKAARQRLATARSAAEKAYEAAVREYTKAKKDEAAALVEKELAVFRKGADLSDTRRRWVHDKGTFTSLGDGVWEEKSPDGTTYKWKETARTKDYVELRATIFNAEYTVRLTARSADYSSGKGGFKPKYTGKWAD